MLLKQHSLVFNTYRTTLCYNQKWDSGSKSFFVESHRKSNCFASSLFHEINHRFFSEGSTQRRATAKKHFKQKALTTRHDITRWQRVDGDQLIEVHFRLNQTVEMHFPRHSDPNRLVLSGVIAAVRIIGASHGAPVATRPTH